MISFMIKKDHGLDKSLPNSAEIRTEEKEFCLIASASEHSRSAAPRSGVSLNDLLDGRTVLILQLPQHHVA
jgi:hypothetical protein